MFSNGSEYADFQSAFCERCDKYNPVAITKEQGCSVEYQISIASTTGNKEDFPYDKLKPVKNSCRYACKEFQCSDKELMEIYNKMIKE